MFAKDLDEMKLRIHKIQCVITDAESEAELLKELEVLQYEKRGSLLTIVARGGKEAILQKVQEKQPLFCEILP